MGLLRKRSEEVVLTAEGGHCTLCGRVVPVDEHARCVLGHRVAVAAAPAAPEAAADTPALDAASVTAEAVASAAAPPSAAEPVAPEAADDGDALGLAAALSALGGPTASQPVDPSTPGLLPSGPPAAGGPAASVPAAPAGGLRLPVPPPLGGAVPAPQVPGVQVSADPYAHPLDGLLDAAADVPGQQGGTATLLQTRPAPAVAVQPAPAQPLAGPVAATAPADDAAWAADDLPAADFFTAVAEDLRGPEHFEWDPLDDPAVQARIERRRLLGYVAAGLGAASAVGGAAAIWFMV